MGWLSSAWKAVTGTVKAIIKNPVTAIAAVGLSIYAPALGARILGSMLVSNVLNAVTAKKPDSGSGGDGSTPPQQGTSQVLSFNTTNKLPVVYGSAFINSMLIDAKISTDNQTMWYVLALAEAPDAGEATVTFGDIYWNEQKITLSSTEYGRVTKLTNNAGQEDTKIDGNLWIYPYSGSSTPLAIGGVSSSTTAFTRLQDSAIPAAARWTGSEAMTGTIFYIVKCVYSTDDNMTGLGGILTQLKVNQTGVSDGYRPGSAMMDYLLNSRYGAGLTADKIYTQSFLDLDAHADVLINFSQFGGGTSQQPRYRFNGIVDTSQNIMSNLLDMADSCDAFIQFNEARGQWAVVTNKSYLQTPNQKNLADLFRLDDTNIIGGVNIVPLDLNSTPNEVESGFSSAAKKGSMAYAYASTPANLRNVNEPINKLTVNYKFINDSVRAQYLSNRKLEQCRADYIVQLTADYSAIQIDAGDVVVLNYQPYGNNLGDWGTSKLFRVNQVVENRGENGNLTVNLSMSEYAEAVYDDRNITEFQPPSGGVVLDPSLLAQPGKPVTSNGTTKFYPEIDPAQVLINGNPASFEVKCETPRSGVTLAMEFWYGPTQEITNNNYVLYSTQYNSAGNQYVNSSDAVPVYERVTVTGLPEGTWYWRVRAIGTSRKSSFTEFAEIIWAPPAAESNIGDVRGNAQRSSAQIVPFEYNLAWPDNTRGIRPSGGVTVYASANPGSVQVSFSASVYSPPVGTPAVDYSQFNCMEVWKNKISKQYNKSVYAIRPILNLQRNSVYATNTYNGLQAVGAGGIDLISSDGGQTWTTADSGSMVTGTTTYIATDTIAYMDDGSPSTLQTIVTGPAQSAGYSSTDFFDAGARVYTSGDPAPYKIYFSYDFYNTPYNSTSIRGSVNGICHTPSTGLRHRPSMSTAYIDTITSIVVGANGLIATMRTISNASDNDASAPYPPAYIGSSSRVWTKENTSNLQNMYDVFANSYNNLTQKQYTAIAVGAAGSIFVSHRNNVVTTTTGTFAWAGKSAYDFDGETSLLADLYGIAGDNSAYTTDTGASVWVAVGASGTLLSSLDNGNTWTRREVLDADGLALASPLRAVRYGNGKWVAVGDKGIIYTSTDAITWTLVTADLTGIALDERDRDYYTVCWDNNNNSFVIGGQNIILYSPDTTISFVVSSYGLSADESSNLTRLWYRGSNDNVQTKTAVAQANRLINGQTVSSTIIDTDYKKGDELQYLLVIGNMDGKLVYADAPVITAVEYKNKHQ